MTLKGRAPTMEEQKWLDACSQIPCIICSKFAREHDSPAEIHHLSGKTKGGAHLRTISLCDKHHRIPDNHHPKRWVSRHGDGRQLFESRYECEGALLDEQKKRVDDLISKCELRL